MTEPTGKIITINPEGAFVARKTASPPTLKELQTLVGGNIEIMWWPSAKLKFDGQKAQYIVNEEGMVHELPINPVATMLAQTHKWQDGIPLFGPMVILTGAAMVD